PVHDSRRVSRLQAELGVSQEQQAVSARKASTQGTATPSASETWRACAIVCRSSVPGATGTILARAFGNRCRARRSALSAGTPSRDLRSNQGNIHHRIQRTEALCEDVRNRATALPAAGFRRVRRPPRLRFAAAALSCVSQLHYSSQGFSRRQ